MPGTPLLCATLQAVHDEVNPRNRFSRRMKTTSSGTHRFAPDSNLSESSVFNKSPSPRARPSFSGVVLWFGHTWTRRNPWESPSTWRPARDRRARAIDLRRLRGGDPGLAQDPQVDDRGVIDARVVAPRRPLGAAAPASRRVR